MEHGSHESFLNRVGRNGAYSKKVSADFYGLLNNGRGVRVEVKAVSGAVLAWSNFREHQPAMLTEYAQALGLSLVVWVHGADVYVMQWEDMLASGFGFGASLKPETARKIRIVAL